MSIVYSNTEYGNNGYNLITSTAARFNICISSPQMINVERFQEEDYDNTIVSLTQKTNAKGMEHFVIMRVEVLNFQNNNNNRSGDPLHRPTCRPQGAHGRHSHPGERAS